MADTGKTIRVARTNIGEPNLTGLPTQRSQVVGQEVHQYRSDAAGLEGLGQVFSDFFGTLQHTAAVVNEGVLVGEKQQIEQENAAQKRQALGDALMGKPMDEKLTGDLDYYDAFRSVTAQRDGYKASEDFNKFYQEEWLPQNPTGDLMAARQDWAAKNLTGSQDADYQGQVLASFFGQTDGMISKQQEYALKYQTAKGMEALGEAIDGTVAGGTMDAGQLSSFIDKARALDPLNSMEAPARVATALLSSAANHPEQMMAISNLLAQEGTGVNGKSFAKSWPDTYADFQNKAVTAYNQINTVKDLAAITDLKDRLRVAKTADDLVEITKDTLKFRQERGAMSETGAILNQISTMADQLDKTETALQGVDGFMSGDTGAASPSDVRKNWTDWLQSRTGTSNVMDLEPAQAVSALQGLQGVVPEEAKAQLSAAITNTKDAAGQAKAISIINALGGQTGKNYAKDYLTDTAAQLYDNVWAISQTTSEPMDSIVARVNAARDGIKDWTVDWKTITKADTADAATTQVNKTIDDTFFNALGVRGFLGVGGGAPQLPLELRQTVLDVARQNAILSDATGRGWEAGVKDAAKDIAANAEVIPGANGVPYISLNADKTTVFIGDDGKETTRPRLGYSVENPRSGQLVDTVSVYNTQLNDLARDNAWTLPNGSTSGVGLSPATSPALTARGLMAVTADGNPIIFAAGEEINLTPKTTPVGSSRGFTPTPDSDVHPEDHTVKFKLPSSEAELDAGIGDHLPKGFKLFRLDTPQGVAWQLAYRPNFGDQEGFTLDEQSARFAMGNGGGW